MPLETVILDKQPFVFEVCPRCGAASPSFLRGQVQRSKRFLGFLWKQNYCAVICHSCRQIIGWERP